MLIFLSFSVKAMVDFLKDGITPKILFPHTPALISKIVVLAR